jgi:hypothetical protein
MKKRFKTALPKKEFLMIILAPNKEKFYSLNKKIGKMKCKIFPLF